MCTEVVAQCATMQKCMVDVEKKLDKKESMLVYSDVTRHLNASQLKKELEESKQEYDLMIRKYNSKIKKTKCAIQVYHAHQRMKGSWVKDKE